MITGRLIVTVTAATKWAGTGSWLVGSADVVSYIAMGTTLGRRSYSYLPGLSAPSLIAGP